MSRPSTPHQPPSATRAASKMRMPQFSIFGLMVLMFVSGVGFASLYYSIRAAQGETKFGPAAVFMSVAAPMLIMIVLSVGLSIRRWLKRRR